MSQPGGNDPPEIVGEPRQEMRMRDKSAKDSAEVFMASAEGITEPTLDILYGIAPIKPETAGVVKPNPNRRWWQFWKPRYITEIWIRGVKQP